MAGWFDFTSVHFSLWFIFLFHSFLNFSFIFSSFFQHHFFLPISQEGATRPSPTSRRWKSWWITMNLSKRQSSFLTESMRKADASWWKRIHLTKHGWFGSFLAYFSFFSCMWNFCFREKFWLLSVWFFYLLSLSTISSKSMASILAAVGRGKRWRARGRSASADPLQLQGPSLHHHQKKMLRHFGLFSTRVLACFITVLFLSVISSNARRRSPSYIPPPPPPIDGDEPGAFPIKAPRYEKRVQTAIVLALNFLF